MKINRNLIQLNLMLFPNSLKEEKLKGNRPAGCWEYKFFPLN